MRQRALECPAPTDRSRTAGPFRPAEPPTPTGAP